MRTSYPPLPLDAEPAHIHPANIIINYKDNFCKDVFIWPKYGMGCLTQTRPIKKHTPAKYNKINFGTMLPTVRNIGSSTKRASKNQSSFNSTITKIPKIKFGTMLPAVRNIGRVPQKRQQKALTL